MSEPNEYLTEESLHIGIKTVDNKQADQLSAHFWIIERLERVKLSGISSKIQKPTHSTSVLVGTYELYVNLEGLIDLEKEKEKNFRRNSPIGRFFKGIQAKLANDKFVDNAPKQVVDNERKKESDTLQKLQSLTQQQPMERLRNEELHPLFFISIESTHFFGGFKSPTTRGGHSY